MRISQVDAAKSKAELTKALAGPVFTSNADNAFVPWPGGVIANPLCQNWADSPTAVVRATISVSPSGSSIRSR